MIGAMNKVVRTAYSKFVDARPNVRTFVMSESTEAKGCFPWTTGLQQLVKITRGEE